MDNDGKPRQAPGKLSARGLKDIVFGQLGARDPVVSWGPGTGRDFNVIDIDDCKVMLVTTDPLYVNLAFGIVEGTWLGFQILLADMLVSGIDPRHAIFSLHLPAGVDEGLFARAWHVLHGECKRRGISIISGHTGSYEGCGFPVIGSGTLLATCTKGEHVSIHRTRAGDDVILGNLPAMESYASLLKVDANHGRAVFGTDLEDVAGTAWRGMSVEPQVSVLRARARASGIPLHELVSGMHDVAEGGVFRAMRELCEGTSTGCALKLDDFPLDEGFIAFMGHHFAGPVDPWIASGQGGLLITCRPERTRGIVDAMLDAGVPTGRIGTLKEPTHGTRYALGGHRGRLGDRATDPFWPALVKATTRGGARP